MPKYKLTYFNGRARAEISRLLFAAADVEYEDVRINPENWPAEKSIWYVNLVHESQPNGRFHNAKTAPHLTYHPVPLEFNRARPIRIPLISFSTDVQLAEELPLGQLPVLEIDGVEYPQSVAQHRFLAATFGFMGSDALENLQCDVIVDTCNDLRIPYLRDIIMARLRTKDIEKEEEAKQKLLDEGLPKFLPIFDKFLSDFGGESGYFVGSKLTWADFAVHEILELPFDLFPDMKEKYPKLAKHRELVESNPRIKAYLEKRPKTFA